MAPKHSAVDALKRLAAEFQWAGAGSEQGAALHSLNHEERGEANHGRAGVGQLSLGGQGAEALIVLDACTQV